MEHNDRNNKTYFNYIESFAMFVRAMSEETSLLIPKSSQLNLNVYRRRWYILLLFSLLGFIQCAVWNTWGPIASSALAAYPSWTEATIAMFSNWGTLMFIIFTLPVTALYSAYGLRPGVLFAGLLISSGSLIRCIFTQEPYFTVAAHVGAILNGIAGIVVCSLPSALSALWFPANERTSAISIATLFNQLGNAGGFLLGLGTVREPLCSNNNCTAVIDIRNDISNLLNIEAVACCILFVLVILYFPSRPPLPPSTTSTVSRIIFKRGLAQISRNKNIWLIVIGYSISQGVLGVWFGVLNISLQPLGIGQAESGWLGMWSVIASCVSSFGIARLSDVQSHRLKRTLLILLGIATAAFSLLFMICLKLIPTSSALLWISVIVGSCASYATTPLFFELGAEIAFPVDEAIVGGVVSCCCNTVGAAFLFAFFIPGIGVSWVIYCLVLAPILAIPCVGLTKEEYRRRDHDILGSHR